jgi:hypothetical protein
MASDGSFSIGGINKATSTTNSKLLVANADINSFIGMALVGGKSSQAFQKVSLVFRRLRIPLTDTFSSGTDCAPVDLNPTPHGGIK